MHYEIAPKNIKVDNFGAGANVSQEIALGVNERVHAVNVGNKPKDDRFLNIRAEMYWLLREWIKKGGKLIKNEAWRQLLVIRYKRTLSGKIQIMSKEEMVKHGWDSPDEMDAVALSFVPENVGTERIAVPDFNDYSNPQLSNEDIAKLTDVY